MIARLEPSGLRPGKVIVALKSGTFDILHRSRKIQEIHLDDADCYFSSRREAIAALKGTFKVKKIRKRTYDPFADGYESFNVIDGPESGPIGAS